MMVPTMRRRVRGNVVLIFAGAAIFILLTLRFPMPQHHDLPSTGPTLPYTFSDHLHNHARRVSSLPEPSRDSVSVLLPDWDVLLIADSRDRSIADRQTFCFFQNNATSPARFAGTLPSGNRSAFKCSMPNSVRRLRPFLMPILTSRTGAPPPEIQTPELFRWTFLVYESLATESDVVLFVKGVNHRQGMSRSPEEFRCVFFGDSFAAVRTAVTSSSQEVFRCAAPDLTALGPSVEVRVSLEIRSENNLVVPSVARYVPRRSVAGPGNDRLLCASAMVYNAAKFLREWVTYHSRIGVDKFMLYDNDSDDDLNGVVSGLRAEGFDVTTTFWIWPKTQEAGFSHAAVYGKDSCAWMMYVDVDEFVFSPSWAGSSEPSTNMLKSLLPTQDRSIGQVSIRCNEFGPSNQRSHPAGGVTQGYTCRRSVEQRHKSIVRLDAVDHSLLNVVHHFRLGTKLVTKSLNMDRGVVNHYKYQAWPEFRNKFRRRVSAYVVDWTQKSNLGSKDRTPGLGFEPIEPKGWDTKFCEVRDERLMIITRTWFATPTLDGYNMAWQR